MEIRFSRHAKRRASLYKIPESTIMRIPEGRILNQGQHTIVEAVEGFKHPLKIVASATDDIITVITSYPLRKGKKT